MRISMVLPDQKDDRELSCLRRYEFAPGQGRGQLRRATLTMFASIIEWPRANGYNQIVTAADKNFERVLRGVGSWKAPLRETIIAQLCAEIMLNPDGGLLIEQLGYGVEPAGLKFRRSRAAYGQTNFRRNARRQGAA